MPTQLFVSCSPGTSASSPRATMPQRTLRRRWRMCWTCTSASQVGHHTHTHGRMHAHHTQVYTRHTRARITAGTSHVQARHGWAVQIWATGGAVCAAPICLACMHLHGVGVRRTSLLSLSAKPASGEGGASVGAVGQRQRPCLL